MPPSPTARIRPGRRSAARPRDRQLAAEQPGVSRFNDIDEFGEQFNSGIEKSSYGQPIVFDVGGSGDPFAYAHKSLPGQIDGGFAPWDSWVEHEADQTNSSAC